MEQLPAGSPVRVVETLTERLREELRQAETELREVELMLSQSQKEVERLTQRNTSISMHLQQIQAQMDTAGTGELNAAYEAALEARQRLLLMRSQVEKLQADQNGLKRLIALLEELLVALEQATESSEGGSRGLKSVEMMINAQEAERRRLSRQMHDGPAQALSNFILQTEIAARLFEVNPDQARQELVNLKTAATSTFQQVRDFIFELRPMMLDDLGLVPTVRRYVDVYREQTGTDIQIMVTGEERRLETYIEVMLFRAVQELLSNAVHHGEAQSIKVNLDLAEEQVRVRVEDNGKGFDPATLETSQGLGLRLLRERVQMVGGTFEVHSRIGEGTEVMFTVPASKAPVFL